MMIPRYVFTIVVLLAVTLISTSCDDTIAGNDGEDETSQSVTVEDLAADPLQSTGEGRPSGTGRYTFFNLEDSSVVLSSSELDRADSNSTQWDIAFQATNVLVNGGTSGPGQGAGYVATEPFDALDTVDESMLVTDDAAQGAFAVPPGSGDGWYNYSGPPNHTIAPIPGRTIVVRTADGKRYAKIRILSYYQGNPELPTDDPSRYYTFDYVLSPSGTSTFE